MTLGFLKSEETDTKVPSISRFRFSKSKSYKTIIPFGYCFYILDFAILDQYTQHIADWDRYEMILRNFKQRF